MAAKSKDGKTLVIVESPAKARTIAKFLGKDYVIEASVGHIRDLPANADEVPAAIKKEKWSRLGIDITTAGHYNHCSPQLDGTAYQPAPLVSSGGAAGTMWFQPRYDGNSCPIIPGGNWFPCNTQFNNVMTTLNGVVGGGFVMASNGRHHRWMGLQDCPSKIAALNTALGF